MTFNCYGLAISLAYPSWGEGGILLVHMISTRHKGEDQRSDKYSRLIPFFFGLDEFSCTAFMITLAPCIGALEVIPQMWSLGRFLGSGPPAATGMSWIVL